MNILVLVKPVPDPDKYNEITIDPKTKRLIREGVATVINPTDRNALEAALKIRDAKAACGENASISVLSMAPEFSRDKIVECLAMGADDGYLLSDVAFAGADTYATSYVLAQGIKKIAAEKGADFDLILAGNESADGATAHVPVQVAEWLEISHISRVCSLNADGDTISLVKRSEDVMLSFQGEGPAVLAVTRDINKPRFVNAMGIVKARKKPLTIWSNEDLKLDPARLGLEGSPTQPGQLITPQLQRAGVNLVSGDDATAYDAAKAILSIMRKAGV